MSQVPRENAVMHYDPDKDSLAGQISNVQGVKERHESRLLAIDGVTGVGVGADRLGNEAIVVYLSHPSQAKPIPDQIEGVPVITEVTGEIDAY
jgi:hypothetical protein